MIKFADVSQANFNGLHFVIQGDAAATVLKFNVGKAPFNVLFNGVIPDGLFVSLQTAAATATGSIALVSTEAIVTITFSAAPPTSQTFGVDVTFLYNSLP